MADLFLQLGLMVAFSTLGIVVATKFRQPPVIGLIIAGVAIGPKALGLVSQTDIISVFADIGSVLLLFAIGVEFSVSKLLRHGITSVFVGLMKVSAIFFLSYQLGLALGFDSVSCLYLGALLSITSTTLMMRILKDKKMFDRDEMPVLFGSMVVEDIIAVFFLTFFSALNAGGNTSAFSILFSISKAVLILVVGYLVLSAVLKPIVKWMGRYQSRGDAILSAALGLGLGLAGFASVLGLSPAIGAFLAGSLSAGIQSRDEIERQINPFILLFSSVFFLSIGMMVDLAAVAAHWEIIAVITVASIIFTFLASSASTYLNGFSSPSAVFSGLAMIAVGEFSLLIAKQAPSYNGFDFVGLTSVLVVATVTFNSLVVTRHRAVYRLVYGLVPESVKESGRNMARRIAVTVRAIQGSFEMVRTIYSIAREFSGMLVAGAATLVLVTLFGRNLISFQNFVVGAQDIFVALGVFAALAFAVRLALESRHLLFEVSQRFHGRREGLSGSVLLVFAVFGVLFVLPFLLSFFELPSLVSQLQTLLVLAVLLVLFLYSGRCSENRRHNVAFFKK